MCIGAFENCPDILKVDWEMYYNCPELGIFVLTLDSFVRILSGEGLLLRALCIRNTYKQTNMHTVQNVHVDVQAHTHTHTHTHMYIRNSKIIILVI